MNTINANIKCPYMVVMIIALSVYTVYVYNVNLYGDICNWFVYCSVLFVYNND